MKWVINNCNSCKLFKLKQVFIDLIITASTDFGTESQWNNNIQFTAYKRKQSTQRKSATFRSRGTEIFIFKNGNAILKSI